MTPEVLAALDPDEQEALRKLTTMGYRITGEQIWMTTSDEPDAGWEGTLVGYFRGSGVHAYETLKMYGFPQDSFITCPQCDDGNCELGGLCAFCSREAAEWERAGEYM